MRTAFPFTLHLKFSCFRAAVSYEQSDLRVCEECWFQWSELRKVTRFELFSAPLEQQLRTCFEGRQFMVGL
jgi:hypothetical protein